MRSYYGIPVVLDDAGMIFDGGFDSCLGDFIATENWNVQCIQAVLRNISSGYLEIAVTKDGVSYLREPFRITTPGVAVYASLPKRGRGLPFGSKLSFTGDGQTAVNAFGLTIQIVLGR